MKIIQGKQAVLRPYLSEGQCARPVQGQYVTPGKPVDYEAETVPVTQAEPVVSRECIAEYTEPVRVQTHTVRVTEVSEEPLHSANEAVVYPVAGAETKVPREHFVQKAKTREPVFRESAVETAAMQEADVKPLSSVMVSLDAGQVLDVAEGENLTLGKLFHR